MNCYESHSVLPHDFQVATETVYEREAATSMSTLAIGLLFVILVLLFALTRALEEIHKMRSQRNKTQKVSHRWTS